MKSINTASLAVNGNRLNQSIATLASIGQLPNGGVKRIAYSKKDRESAKSCSAMDERTRDGDNYRCSRKYYR